jgi:hypothetical protein
MVVNRIYTGEYDELGSWGGVYLAGLKSIIVLFEMAENLFSNNASGDVLVK